MKRTWFVLALGLLTVTTALGCGKSAPPKNFAADSASPDAATRTFMEALRTGDDKKATAMLTPTARKKTAEKELSVTPQASQTATFKVGQVEYVTDEKDGAHVASTWTDLDLDNQPTTHQIIWILREEEEGWRVAGMAIKIFDGEKPLILNFEDPDDMTRKQELAAEEIARRKNATMNPEQNQEARQPTQPDDGTLK